MSPKNHGAEAPPPPPGSLPRPRLEPAPQGCLPGPRRAPFGCLPSPAQSHGAPQAPQFVMFTSVITPTKQTKHREGNRQHVGQGREGLDPSSWASKDKFVCSGKSLSQSKLVQSLLFSCFSHVTPTLHQATSAPPEQKHLGRLTITLAHQPVGSRNNHFSIVGKSVP